MNANEKFDAEIDAMVAEYKAKVAAREAVKQAKLAPKVPVEDVVRVHEHDFNYSHWLDEPGAEPSAKNKRSATGKRPRIKARLAEMHPNGAPVPALLPRKTLKNDLIKRYKTLEPLDDATLKAAIDEYNAETIRSNPK